VDAVSTAGGPPIDLSVPSVLLAGLVDSINPCAFSTIIFLVAMLGSARRSRREIMLIGIVYVTVVYGGYPGVGLDLFTSVRALMVFLIVTRIVRGVLAAALCVLAALSIRDAFLARAGRIREMTSQFSLDMKRRILPSFVTASGVFL
jgi:cytochrome c biogenesis protein CcdA